MADTPGTPPQSIPPEFVEAVARRVVELTPRRKFNFAPARFALARLGEPSTWLAIFAALALLGFTLPAGQAADVAKGLAALSAVVAGLAPEHKSDA